MIVLPNDLNAASQDPFPADPFYWCWHISVERNASPTPSTVLRIVNAEEEVDLGDGLLYYPFPVSHTPLETSGDGDLPTMRVSIDNRGRWLMPYLDQTRGFIGNAVTLTLVSRASLSTAQAITFAFQIAKADANAEAVTFQLEIPSPLHRRIPIERYNPSRCDSKFGDARCGYIRNGVAAYSTCNKTLSDCILRGDDEDARRIPRLHPTRFGAFRGTAVARR